MDVDNRTVAVQNGPQSLGFPTQSQPTTVNELADGVRGNAVPADVRVGVRGNAVAAFPAWYNCTKMIYVRPNPKTGVPSGHWPIPESFFPDGNISKLVGYSES